MPRGERKRGIETGGDVCMNDIRAIGKYGSTLSPFFVLYYNNNNTRHAPQDHSAGERNTNFFILLFNLF